MNQQIATEFATTFPGESHEVSQAASGAVIYFQNMSPSSLHYAYGDAHSRAQRLAEAIRQEGKTLKAKAMEIWENSPDKYSHWKMPELKGDFVEIFWSGTYAPRVDLVHRIKFEGVNYVLIHQRGGFTQYVRVD